MDDIDTNLCTHVVYAFAILDPNSLEMVAFDNWLDIQLKNYEKFAALKQKNPKLKLLMALGGWTDSRSDKYKRLIRSPVARQNFIT